MTGYSSNSTTKMAPHLDGVHVVFGLVISGFEVIKKIEGLKADSSSRPYADVRVVDCGQLITKSANDVLEGKRKRTPHSAESSVDSHKRSSQSSSSTESESQSEEKHQHRKHKKHGKSKRSRKKRRVSKREKHNDDAPSVQSPVKGEMAEEEGEEDGEKEQGVKRGKPVVRPEEIPPVPENRFLLRRDMPAQEEKPETANQEESSLPSDMKPAVTKSGRKMKGRGTMRYHTPTRSKSRSASVEERGSSETPPHWKEEMKRTQVYQPPSLERWSKGDKLNDRSSSRWDDRSDSVWSQSPEHSSDHSSERSSPQRPPKKEKKKAKRKKKAKKRKRSKKSTKDKHPEPHLSEGERSVSSRKRSKTRRSRSLSHSTSSHRHSTASRRRRSSLSSRDSRSYSRSYTASRSRSHRRSRSYSRSRSPYRSRSRSVSRSRSRSQTYSPSRSRSRTRSRHRSRSLSRSRRRNMSRSPRSRKASKPKPQAPVQVTDKFPESKSTPVSRLPTVPVPESVPVMPLSDSPPPSRWKPGQKPWKSTYVHIPEIKAKPASAALTSTSQAGISSTDNMKTLVTSAGLSGDSQAGYGDPNKTHRPTRRSQSMSSRSRSYSRSRSRSVSRSRSPRLYDSRSSSYSRSGSEKRHNKGSAKKTPLDKQWKKYYSSLRRIKNLDKYISIPAGQDPHLESEDGTNSDHSSSLNRSKGGGSLGQLKEQASPQVQGAKHHDPLPLEELKTEWDSDKASQVSSINSLSRKQKTAAQISEPCDKRFSAHVGWDSESDGEKVPSKAAAISEKEEGEASSESEHETSRKTAASDRAHAPRNALSQSGQSPEKVTEAERHKSKKKAKRKHKHKRRGESKSGSHRRTKDKAKRSKYQKLKETFHWQPPLEFGEEEDEDESQKEKRLELKLVKGTDSHAGITKERQSRSPVDDGPEKNGSSYTPPNQSSSVQTESHKRENPKPADSERHSSNRNSVNSPSLPIVRDQAESYDDMDICTPEHDTETIVDPSVTDNPFNKHSELTLKTTSISPSKMSKDGDSVCQTQNKELQSVPLAASVTAAVGQQDEAGLGKAAIDMKWRPLKGTLAFPSVSLPPITIKSARLAENQTAKSQSVRMEIKSKSRVRPGSLFDEVRKTARLNQRPRNQDSSSEERSPTASGTRGESRTRSTRKSRSVSSHRSRSRGRSRSYSKSRSSSSYSSRSRSRSRGRRRGRGRSHSRSSTYRSYRSHSRTYSRSHSRGHSYGRRRRSRSKSYGSYSSRSCSRSVSRRRGRRRSDSYRSSERRSRSYRSSSGSTSRHSGSSRYS